MPDADRLSADQPPAAPVGAGGSVARMVFDSPVGPLVAGATDDGVCLLGFVRGREEARPGGAAATDHLNRISRELRAYFAGESMSFSVPLVMEGTEFERAVWRMLLTIPAGETKSYGSIAAALGDRGASRAVGRANGRNPVAIVVPCHRVIETGGGLGGYGGGLERKKWLLEHERRVTGATLFPLGDEHKLTVRR